MSEVSIQSAIEVLIFLCSITLSWIVILKKLDKKIRDLIINGTNKEIKNTVSEGFDSQKKSINQINSSIDIISKAIRDELRESILNIYEETVSSGSINDNEFYVVQELYNDYRELGGNSFIQDAFSEIEDIYKQNNK